MSELLPPCPLCGRVLGGSDFGPNARCTNSSCPLAFTWIPHAAWRRLAAPFEILREIAIGPTDGGSAFETWKLLVGVRDKARVALREFARKKAIEP